MSAKLGRPRTVRSPDDQGRGERLDVTLDVDADTALTSLWHECGVPKAKCVRLLLRAWNEDTGMKKAFAGWRKGAGK